MARNERLILADAQSDKRRGCASGFVALATGDFLAARKKRQGQNHLPGFIRYDHHQSQIILVAALFS
jgi:hypothetical protein